MDAETASARLRLDAWREQGADRLDPVRFGLMDALETRRHGHAGEARRLLDARLSSLLQDHAAAVAAGHRSGATAPSAADVAAASEAEAASTPARTSPPANAATTPLGGLVARLDRHRTADVAQHCIATSGDAAPGSGAAAARASTADGKTFASPALLEEFRELWDGIRGDSRLRQSQDPAPLDAGPLNSVALAHRTLARMLQLSPGYARHFLAYVEILDWLERLPGAAPSPRSPSRRRSS